MALSKASVDQGYQSTWRLGKSFNTEHSTHTVRPYLGHVTGYENSSSLTLTGLCWCCRRYGDSSLASLFVCMCSEDAAVTMGRNAEFTGKICFQVQNFGAGLLQPNNRCGKNLTLTFVDDVAVIVGERQTRHLGACQADWSTRCISQNSMKATRCLQKSSECRNALA